MTATQLYGPYGAVRFQSGTLPTDKGYTGQRADAATSGLDDYGARYYDPVAGQFTSADTWLAGGQDRYGYVAGNPETNADPSGHLYAPPRDTSWLRAMQQSQDQPHTSYGSLSAFVAGLPQFLLGVNTLSQSFHTLFQDPHASAGDKWQAAGAAGLTVGIDLVTMGSALVGDPEAGETLREADEGLLAADDAKAAVASTTEVASETAAAGDGYLDLAHGTSLENAQAIADGGLNADAARAATTGGQYSEPGSFFTFNVSEYGQQAIQDAHDMGLTQSNMPVVLIGRLSRFVYDGLVAEGAVRITPIPGVDTPETVFSPSAFALLNEAMQWFEPLDPWAGRR